MFCYACFFIVYSLKFSVYGLEFVLVLDLFSATLEDDADGVDEYFDVGGDGHVFHVEEVVFEAFAHLVDGGGVAVFDLPPGGDAGFDALEEEVFGAAFDDLVDVELPLGAVADDGHGAFEDVVELGYLVEAHFAHDAAEGGDAGVVVARECGAAGFGVGVHAAEFVHFEGFAFVADAFLCVEDGAWRGGFDDDGGDEVDRREYDQCEEGYEYVGDTRTVDVHIKRLREKINDHDNWRIATIWGIGYKFEVQQ